MISTYSVELTHLQCAPNGATSSKPMVERSVTMGDRTHGIRRTESAKA